MNLRKLFALVMAAIMLLGMMPDGIAEGGNMLPGGNFVVNCDHNWEWNWPNGQPSNCQEWKESEEKCTKCGAVLDVYEQNGPCEPGDKQWVRPQGSNCQEWGVWEITCRHCGEWLDGGEEPGPHSWKTETLELPGCTLPGYKQVVCSVCGDEQGDITEIPPTGHDWGDWEWDFAPPTCTEGAGKHRTCRNCRDREEGWEGFAGHQWGGVVTVVPATCEQPGQKAPQCTACGAYGEYQEIPALGHDWGSWQWAHGSAPTCNQGAWQVRNCNRCGQQEDRWVEGGDHQWGEWFRNGIPTCMQEGIMRRVCQLCGAGENDSIPRVGHNFGEWYVVAEAQVGLPGVEQRDCTYGCGTFEQREIPALEQDFGNDELVGADGLELTLVLSSTPANGTHFAVGEEVIFTETWSNGTGKTLYPFSVSIWTCGTPVFGSEIDQICSWFAEDGGGPVAPGASGSHTLTVIVTEADVARGAIYAMAELLSTVHNGADLENVTTPFVTAPCGTGEPLPTVVLEKQVMNAPANGEFFVPGEAIQFGFTLWVYGPGKTKASSEYIVKEAMIYDPLKEDQIVMVDLDGTWNMGNAFLYTVTEEDARRGYVENTGYATWVYVENGKPGRVDSNTVTTPCGPGDLPENYVPPVNPDVDGDGIPNGEDPDVDGDGTPNGSDPDVDGDAIPNGEDPDADGDGIPNGEDPDVDGDGIPNGEDPDKNGDGIPDGTAPDSGLSAALSVIKKVTSSPGNGSFYVPGEIIFFEITATNTSAETLTNLTFHDPLISAAPGATVPTFTPGEAAYFQAFYLVTDAEAFAGSVTNIAYVTATDANGHQVMEYSNDVTVPCGFPEGEDPFGIFHSVAVVKTEESMPLNGQYYTEGEVIHYSISYTNDGELPLTDVEIWDVMDPINPVASAEMLQPGESRVCYYQHTVTAEDVAVGSVMNVAHASYPVSNAAGFANSASNVVISKTSGYDWVWCTPIFPESGEDPEYDPGTGWFPDGDPVPEGDTPPFGTIDTDTLHGGDTYCVRTITGRDNVSVSNETTFCSVHSPIQSSMLLMTQAAATPEMQTQTAAYAVALWRTEVQKLYQEIYKASDPMAKVIVMTEYVRFLTDVANYEAMLKLRYTDQPAVVDLKVAEIWENKCVDLCYDAHAAAAERKDSLLAVTPATGAAAGNCTCEVTAQESGKKTSVRRYCPAHSFPFSMIDALLQGNDTAESWTMVRRIWDVELTSAYSKLYAAMGDNKLLAMAEYNALTQWMAAREASLIALYPENPEIVVQIMVKTIMERVNDLCQVVN